MFGWNDVRSELPSFTYCNLRHTNFTCFTKTTITLILYYIILLHATPGKQSIIHKCFTILYIIPRCMMEQPEMKIDFIQALQRLYTYAWPSWYFLYIIRRHSIPLHPNQQDLCWHIQANTNRYNDELNRSFGMAVFGGLGVKLCNFVVLELLVLIENHQQALDALTPEQMIFMMTHSGQYLSIHWWIEPHFWNGSFGRFGREIMQF